MKVSKRKGMEIFLTRLLVSLVLMVTQTGTQASGEQVLSDNLIIIPGLWKLDKAEKTEANFSPDRSEAAEGRRCVRVTVGKVNGWGPQVGQLVPAGTKGKTYTLAVMVKCLKNPVKMDLRIERASEPYDQALKSQVFTPSNGVWSELHATFKVEKDFAEGWFAYINGLQSNAEFLAEDMFSLYEGEYIPRAEREKKELAEPTTAVHLFDMGSTASAPLAPEMVSSRKGWKEIIGNGSKSAIKGDLCAANTHLSLVIRKGAEGPEWYYRTGDQMVKGPTLIPAGANGDKAKETTAFQIAENASDRLCISVTSKTVSGRKIVSRYLLKKNLPYVETQPGEGTETIHVVANSRHAVLPDIFGGDLLADPRNYASSQIRFPSENMVLQFVDGGDAIVMCVWRSAGQRVNMTLAGEGEKRIFTSTTVGYEKDKGDRVWVAVLAAPKIWFRQNMSELNAVKDKKLDWQVPFRSVWRANYQRADGLIDSWSMFIKSNENYDILGVHSFYNDPSRMRTMWASCRGTFAWPACMEDHSALLRACRFEGLPELSYKTDGYVLIYPFYRNQLTPPTSFAALDILRMALRDTPESKLAEEMRVVPVERCGSPQFLDR